jgi:hypothetical protein
MASRSRNTESRIKGIIDYNRNSDKFQYIKLDGSPGKPPSKKTLNILIRDILRYISKPGVSKDLPKSIVDKINATKEYADDYLAIINASSPLVAEEQSPEEILEDAIGQLIGVKNLAEEEEEEENLDVLKNFFEEQELKATTELTPIYNESEDQSLIGLIDDFTDAFINYGYTDEMSDRIINELEGTSLDEIKRVFEIIKKNPNKIVPFEILFNRNLPLGITKPMELPLLDKPIPLLDKPIPILDMSVPEPSQSEPIEQGVSGPIPSDPITVSGNEATTENIEPQEPQEPIPMPKNVMGSSSGNIILPFVKRYHEISILLYFGDSSYPKWDLKLESNILKMEISKQKIIMMMEDIIKNYGSKIFVSSRLSSSREELNELVQLQFKYKSIKVQSSVQMANVKLSDLVKIDSIANNPMNPSGNNLVVNPIKPITSVSPQTEPIVMTKSEDEFIRNYDAYLTQRNLNLNYSRTRQEPKEEINGGDPRNIGLIKGNNFNYGERVRESNRRI